MESLVASLRKSFNSGITHSLEWRLKQLNAIERLVDENKDELCQALKHDLNKAEHESSTETRNTNGKGSFKKSSRVASQTPSLDAQAKIEKLDSIDELSFIPARDQEMTEVDQKLIFLT